MNQINRTNTMKTLQKKSLSLNLTDIFPRFNFFTNSEKTLINKLMTKILKKNNKLDL
jgi:hypothetical protein